MKHLKLAGSTAALALLAGNAALAQVTPEEVWQNWQDMSAGYGQTMSATSATRDGDTLVVEGLSIKQDQDGVVVDATIDEVNFTDNGDGTVEVTMSDSYPMKLTLPPSDGVPGATPTDLTIAVSQPGLVITAAGSPEETSYDFEAPTLGIKLEAIDGVDAGAVDATADITLTAVTGGYVVAGAADAKEIDSTFGAQSLAMTVVAKDSETQSDLRMVMTVADLQGTSASSLLGMDLMATNVAAALKQGFSVDGAFTHGAMSFALDVTEATGPTKIAATAQEGGLTFAMSDEGLVYGVKGTSTELTMSGPEIPMPELKVSYAEIAFNLAMPLLASAEAGDFGFLTRIVDLKVSDELWAMFDPAGTLPHDPATVILDTKGSVTLTTDLVDEAAMAALGEVPPGQLQSLDVTEIKVTAAGADLTGAGAFTFDNSDTVTFPGFPTPTGKLDLKLLGGNGLLDKLVSMGVLTAEDATGARMMMSMFANAGPGTDELNSTLEFKDKGFFANGQRLQ